MTSESSAYRALKARLVAEATRCCYCGARLVDQTEWAAYTAKLGPWPSAPGGYRDNPALEAEWEAFDEEMALYSWRRDELVVPEGEHPQIDHRVPQCRGGSDEEWNLSVACGACNLEKRERSVWAFLNEERDDFGPAPSKLTQILRRRGPLGTGGLSYHTRKFLEDMKA